MMAHTKDFQENLFQEIKGRIKETDQSVPVKRDDYFYYTRMEEGKQYPIYCRRKDSMETDEIVMLNVNQLAEGHEFCSVGGYAVSFDQELLAYPMDTVGRRKYTIYFKNLLTGETLLEIIPDTTPSLAWANDNQTLFYVKQHPQTLRFYQVYRHELGTDPSNDLLVYEEKDEEFNCYVFKTKSKKFIMIASHQTLSSEYRFLEADHPDGVFKIVSPREENHEYSVDHYKDHFYIRTNDQAKNFRLMKTPVDQTGKEHWRELIPHRTDVFLRGFELFKDHLVVSERKDGLTLMRIIPWKGGEEHELDFGEPTYAADFHANPKFDTPLLHYQYTSMTTPDSVYEYNMNTRKKKLLKQEEILGGFKPENYTTERLWAKAEDGVKIPLSIVYRKGLKKDGSNPLLLYGYGSYGHTMTADFDSQRLSLIDRGFVYAIAHIRGGGRRWEDIGTKRGNC